MIRLALFLVLAAVIQVDATWNFNRLWDNVRSSDSDYRLGKCVWTWLKTLHYQGYSCDSSDDDNYPRIKIPTSYLANPKKDKTLSSALAQLKCTPHKSANIKKAVLCGNGWIRYNSYWCICKGVLSCVNPTPAPTTTTRRTTTRAPTTTTKPTTPTPTPAPTTTTTLAPTTPAPETPAPTTPAPETPAPTTTAAVTPAPTTPATTVVFTTPRLSSPIITSSDVAEGSQVTFVGRQSYTYSFTITCNPSPSSVTISKGTFSATLSGFQLSSPANTYLYTYTFVVADTSYDGLWTVSADNNFGPPATYQFTVQVNEETLTISTWGQYEARSVLTNNLVAFQMYQCSNILLTFAPQPGGGLFTQGDYEAGNYLLVVIDGSPAGSWFSNFANEGSGVLAGGDCTVEPAAQPFWMMVQLTPLGSNSYSLALWTSPQYQYIPSTAASVTTLTIPSLSYTIESILFDQLVPDNGIPVYYYYPNAV